MDLTPQNWSDKICDKDRTPDKVNGSHCDMDISTPNWPDKVEGSHCSMDISTLHWPDKVDGSNCRMDIMSQNWPDKVGGMHCDMDLTPQNWPQKLGVSHCDVTIGITGERDMTTHLLETLTGERRIKMRKRPFGEVGEIKEHCWFSNIKFAVTPTVKMRYKKSKTVSYIIDHSCDVHLQLAASSLTLTELDFIMDLRRKQVKTILLLRSDARSVQTDKFKNVVTVDLLTGPPHIRDILPLFQRIFQRVIIQ